MIPGEKLLPFVIAQDAIYRFSVFRIWPMVIDAVLEHFSMTHDEFNDEAQQVAVGNEGSAAYPVVYG